MTSPWLLASFPFIGAAIGWCTNWLAVKMIFRPREPVSILGFKVQGLLPRRRADLARNVAETVERDLLSVETIQKLVKGLAEGDQVRSLLHSRLDDLISQQLEKLGPIVKKFISDDLVDKIKKRVEDEVLLFIAGMSEELHKGIEENLDIRDMVRSRIEGFDLVKLEEIVFRIAAKELRHIEILGAVLGFTVGLVQVLILTIFAGD